MSNGVEIVEGPIFGNASDYESNEQDAHGYITMLREDLRDYLRYLGMNHELVQEVEEAYVQLVESNAADYLHEVLECALHDTLQEVTTDSKEKSDD